MVSRNIVKRGNTDKGGNAKRVTSKRITRGTKKAASNRGGNRAKKNMTQQLKMQLNFLTHNLWNKERELKYAEKFVGRVPGAKAMVDINKRGIAKVKKDIAVLKVRIRKLQKEGKIERIL